MISGTMQVANNHVGPDVNAQTGLGSGFVDSEPDLEAVIDNDGSEWADVTENDTAKSPPKPSQVQVASPAFVPNSGDPSQPATVSEHPTPDNGGAMTVQHKAQVPPIFVAYSRTQSSARLPISQVVVSITQSMHGTETLDAVQPMKAGWYIYMHTLKDRDTLVQQGITLAGCFVLLRADTRPAFKDSVKMTIKDLPLHSVSNKDVLEAVKSCCPVLSEVKYSNLWVDGQLTNICNGDRFIYIEKGNLVPDTIIVQDLHARVFKPVALSTCRHCGKEGHRQSDLKCPARAPSDLSDSVEAFHGSKHQLSNLHQCPEGCVIKAHGTEFVTSEHYYQFQKLKDHDQGKTAYLMLVEQDGFKAMCMAHKAVPDDKVTDEWKDKAKDVMLDANRCKYQACEHDIMYMTFDQCNHNC